MILREVFLGSYAMEIWKISKTSKNTNVDKKQLIEFI